MKCPDCKHELSWHYEDDGCKVNPHCECSKSPSDIYYELLTEAKQFIEKIATDWEHEEEYAGRMEDYCTYCGTWQEPRKPKSHDEDCLHLKAVEFLRKLEDTTANKP